MKRIIFVLIFVICIISFSYSQTVNGDTLTVDGKKILKVWGTHYERGYATGYLLGDRIKSISENYYLGYIFYNNPVLYETTRTYYLNNFEVEDKYQNEAQGIIDGMIYAGIDLYSNTLQRDIDENDILVSNAIIDLLALDELQRDDESWCSSLSSWGESTILDPELNGDLVITRNMDWTPHNELLENHLLVVHFPIEENETNWLAFTFPGLFGALSALNEDGLCAFMNMGNNNYHPNLNTFHPIFLSIRNGIETYDYNGDMEINPSDIADAIQDKYQLSGSIIHSANQSYAVVIECNNENGVELRDDSDNTIIPEEHLAATNHFRVLYPPVYCYRYENISDSLNSNSNVNINRGWELLAGAAGVPTNLHMIQYAPTLNLIKWSTATAGTPAYQLEPTEFDLEELFTYSTSADPELLEQISLIKSYPNPFYSTTSLYFSLPQASKVELNIFNIKGQKIKELVNDYRREGNYTIEWDGKDEAGNCVVNGIYFYRFETEFKIESGKLILVR